MGLSKRRTIRNNDPEKQGREVSSLCLCGQGNLSRSLRRNGFQPRAQPPDQPAQHDQSDRDQLRASHDSAKYRSPPRIVANELQEITRNAIKEEVRGNHLAIELFPLEQPHQNEKIRQLNRRLKKLRRLQRNSQWRTHPCLCDRTGKSHAP